MPLEQPLLVVLVQPDRAIGCAVAAEVTARGHEVISLRAASWAVPLVRSDLPDAMIVDRGARGYARLMAELDVLPVAVTVVVTRFVPTRCSAEFVRDAAAEIILRVERSCRGGVGAPCRFP